MVSQIYLLLHNIRSTYNVGSIFRTADAAGVKKIYLSGYSPRPIDRFGRFRRDIEKVSLGAERTLPWEDIDNYKKLIRDLKKENFEIVSVEQDPKSIDYKKFKVGVKTLLIFGNEVDGIGEEIMELSDKIIEIPMNGQKESLNVSVAAGIILFQITR